jgi:hypothetical protein
MSEPVWVDAELVLAIHDLQLSSMAVPRQSPHNMK